MKLRFILFFLVIFFTSFSPIILGLTAKPADVTFYWARERIRARNLPALMQEVEQGLDLSMVDPFGNTLLHFAVMRGDVEIVKYLIEAGANVNAQSFDGVTPLDIAIVYEKVEIYTLLVDAGADMNIKNIRKRSFNTQFSDFINVYKDNDLENFKETLREGLDILLYNNEGHTTGCIVIENENADIVDYRTQMGDFFGTDLRFLYELHEEKDWSVFKSIINSNLLALREEIEKGSVDFSMRVGSQGLTLLHLAAAISKDYIIDYLLEAGCDVNVKNNLGETPLHIAIKRKCCMGDPFSVIESLLRAGADVNAQDINGNTPLHIAAERANPKKLLCLLRDQWGLSYEIGIISPTSFKVDISIKNKKGLTVAELLYKQIEWYETYRPKQEIIAFKFMLRYLMYHNITYYNSFA